MGRLALDCKALWDSVARSESSALGMKDKRVAVEALALKRALHASETRLAWVHSQAMLADALTKDTEAGRSILLKCLQGDIWRLVFDSRFLSARKRAERGLDILAQPDVEDVNDTTCAAEPRNLEVAQAL